MTAVARGDRAIALRLGCCALLLYLVFWGGHLKSSDESAVFATTRSLWEERDVAIPPLGPHVYPGRDGRHYAHFSIGQSLLLLPFYGLGKLGGLVLPDPWVAALAGPVRPAGGPPQGGGTIEIAAASLYGPFAAAVLVALFFLFERRLGASRRSALLASALLATTTYVAAMSGYVLRHTTEAVLILLALYAWYGFARDGRLRDLAIGSAAAASLWIVSQPAVIVGPVLAAYLLAVLWAGRAQLAGGAALARHAAAVALPLALALAALLAYNRHVWGSFDNPMLAQRSLFGTPFLYGAQGHLLSPGGSVFAYSPLLLLAPWTFRRFWGSNRRELLAIAGIFLVLLAVHSTFWSWSGMFSAPGPRYLFVALPLGMLPLGPWLDAASRRARRAVVALAVLGAGVQFVLLAARWGWVIRTFGYETWPAPRYEFLFVPQLSPIVGSASAVAHGAWAPWLALLARGWPGAPPRPGAALLLLGLWALAFAAAVVWLLRAPRATPAPA